MYLHYCNLTNNQQIKFYFFIILIFYLRYIKKFKRNIKLPIKKIQLLMKISTLKLGFILIVIFTFSNNCIAQFGNRLRFGGGGGASLYVGPQMDGKISLNTYDKSEINPGLNFQIHYALNDKREIGFRFLSTKLWNLKSGNTIAFGSTINEATFIYQRSLNNNINLSQRSKFTFNMVFGLGALFYNSTMYTIKLPNETLIPFSSVGRGEFFVTSGKQISKATPTVCGVIGFNIGTRLAKNFSLYLENTYTLSGSNYIVGNATTNYWQPNNGYVYYALSLYINFNGKADPLGCPKF
jgi:hypothetical protein